MPFSRPSISDQLASSSVSATTFTQRSRQRRLGSFLTGWLQLNSFGGRLFWMIMVGALTGIGGMAFLFSEMVKYQAEDQVRSTLDGKVNAIASVTEAAETLAYGLGVSATTLHERGAQYPDTYRELTLQLFEGRPEFVVGLGVGQRENGLIADQPWLFPYYWVMPAKTQSSPEQAPVRYEDLADNVGEFYPESERYREYFLPQKDVWTAPYQKAETHLLTYYLPLFTSNGRWLGTTLVDVDGQYLSKLIDDPVFRGMGNFVLITHSGEIIANPANPESNLKTYQDIPDLNEVWQQVEFNGTGFLEGETGYWAYENVPGQNWLVFGFVPYPAVFNRIALITALAVTLMIALLSIAIFLAVRGLNRRLRPVLNQCNQLARTDEILLAQWDQYDDLKQLSFAFFNMLEQLNLNEETIRRHEKKIEKEASYADQVTAQFREFTELLEQQANEQQTLIYQIQQLMDGVASHTQSVDIQLDALHTLGRALSGELGRPVADKHTTENWVLLEKQLQQLTTLLGPEIEAEAAQPLQALAEQLLETVTRLKAHERQRPSLDSLWQQTRDMTQTGQAATADAHAIGMAVQSIAPLLTRLEKIADTIVRRAKSVTD